VSRCCQHRAALELYLKLPPLSDCYTCSALWQLLEAIPADQRRRIASLAIDGTSATTLLIDGDSGRCLAPPKLYNEAQPQSVVQRARQMAPAEHTATAATSTLCKVLAWDEEGLWQGAEAQGVEPAIVHQADWVAGEGPGSEQSPPTLTLHPCQLASFWCWSGFLLCAGLCAHCNRTQIDIALRACSVAGAGHMQACCTACGV
jgi:hypothetical protein